MVVGGIKQNRQLAHLKTLGVISLNQCFVSYFINFPLYFIHQRFEASEFKLRQEQQEKRVLQVNEIILMTITLLYIICHIIFIIVLDYIILYYTYFLQLVVDEIHAHTTY